MAGANNAKLEQIQLDCAWYLKRYAADTPEIELPQDAAAEIQAKKE